MHIYAAMAEQERRMISERTRSALAAAKARGVQLGSYGKVLSAKNAAAAAERDAALRETLAPMVGLPSRTIAEKLNAPGHEAPRGGLWSHVSVLRMMARLGLQTAG